MIPQFFSKLIGPLPPQVKAVISGLAIGALVVLGSALMSYGSVTSFGDWIHTLITGELVAIGTTLVHSFGTTTKVG